MEGKYITKEGLMRSCAQAMCESPITDLMKDAPMLALVFAMYSAEICKRIFAEEAEGEA